MIFHIKLMTILGLFVITILLHILGYDCPWWITYIGLGLSLWDSILDVIVEEIEMIEKRREINEKNQSNKDN